ncbi:hypothetical protein C8J57DRAFT_1290105 [Mycena rebaudengoi]|nr:hypothetical protein C8J57DRAFT_1290105 [Mycena rebaudengoi]
MLEFLARRLPLRRSTESMRLCLRRGFATPATPQQEARDLDGKKPRKSTTPLRRSASASLPIRANPTPTRGSIQTVFTLATAERYLLSRMRNHPDALPYSQKFHESWWVSRWGDKGKEGEIFMFANGSFRMPPTDLPLEVIGRVPEMQVAPLKEPETEELEFVLDPIETTRLQGDLIILGKDPALNEVSPPTKYPWMTISHPMAMLPHSLAKTGKPGMGRTALVKKLGELMKFRQGLNLNRENFSDMPDFYWTEPELERMLIAFLAVADTLTPMSNALDVKVRTDSLNDKITYAAETSTHSMELVIIALIAVEVVIALIRDGPELWEIFTGTPVSHQIVRDPHIERA